MQAGLSLKELCHGICSESTLYRIEKGVNGIKQPSVYLLEALMQRLGRSIDLYFDTFMSVSDFNEKQMRNEIIVLLTLRKYDEAENLLEQLQAKANYQTGINLQFILSSKSTIVAAKEGHEQHYIDLVNRAIKITIPDFDEREIERYRLTYIEITLINKLATHSAENNKALHTAKIYEQLRNSINRFYLDEREKLKTYIMILYNYSKCLGLMKRYDEALEIIAEGEMLSSQSERLTMLPGLMLNKACDYFELGKIDESLPYFALYYYGCEIVEKRKNQNKAKDYVIENLNIMFE
jgi:transcriptional regulator with XRE-family HTH domain